MIGDRIYRFLIPGCVFLLTFASLVAFYPGLSLRGLLGEISRDQLGGSLPAALAGGVFLVAVGYAISEVRVQALTKRIEEQLATVDSSAIYEALGFEKDKGLLLATFNVYCHGVLQEIAPGLKQHLQRSWSHILIATHCRSAITLSGIVFALTPLLACVWALPRPPARPPWLNPYGYGLCGLCFWFLVCLVAYGIIAWLACHFLSKTIDWEIKYHGTLYKVVSESEFGRNRAKAAREPKDKETSRDASGGLSEKGEG